MNKIAGELILSGKLYRVHDRRSPSLVENRRIESSITCEAWRMKVSVNTHHLFIMEYLVFLSDLTNPTKLDSEDKAGRCPVIVAMVTA